MPAVEINRSMLVNLGLSAHPDLTQIVDGQTDEGAAPDVVESFKRLVAADVLAADRDLVATVTAFTSPLELATYFITAKYNELGGAGGMLGTTTSAVNATANGAGFVRTFQHGAVYFHAQVGAHELHGPVRIRWQELGGEAGFLGFPTSDVTPGTDVRSEGVFAHFQGGSIYWAPVPRRESAFTDVTVAASAVLLNGAVSSPAPRPAPTVLNTAISRRGIDAGLSRATTGAVSPLLATATVGERLAVDVRVDGVVGALTPGILGTFETSAGAYEVHGAIRQKYLALGAEASILGYPRTDETSTPDGVGRFNHFQGGSIYWTPATSAHEVHGLIRDRWATLGWERNPQLGYPISDELIPDPRIGHRRPEVRKKPIVAMPSDMIKLPADAALAGFPSTVVNTQPVVATRVREALTPRPIISPDSRVATESALGRLSGRGTELTTLVTDAVIRQPDAVVTLNPDVVGILVGSMLPASEPAETRSVNRFSDFENGVLFWVRGATSATTLAPLASTSDGTSLSMSGAEVAAATMAKVGRAAFQGDNVTVASVSFMGTTSYSFDGAQTHNRRHRLKVILQGIGTIASGPFGTSISGPVSAAIELHVEVWFDAANRRIALTPAQWMLTESNSTAYGATVAAVLRARLDPVLWSSYELLTLPDTDNGEPIAVLSVKTLPNGAIALFAEPRQHFVFGSLAEITNSVSPSVIVLSQPN